MHSRMYTICS